MRPKEIRKTIWTVVVLAALCVGAYFVYDGFQQDPLVAGREALADGDFRSAVQYLKRAVSRGRGTPEVWADLAHAYRFLERHAEAVQALAQATALRPRDHDLLRRYGEALILAGDQEEPPVHAAETFARDYLSRPEGARYAHGQYILGRALQARYSLSMQALEKEIRRRHDGPHIWQILNAIQFALRAEDYFGAARGELISHLVRQSGFASTDPIFEQISMLRRLQDSALDALRKAEPMEQAFGYPTFARATFLLELGKRPEVIQLCRELLSPSVADVADVIRIRAQKLLATALAEKADAPVAKLREAAGLWGAYIYGLDSMPGTPRERNLLRHEAHEARGQIFVRLEDSEGLAEVAGSLLKSDPDNAVGLFFRGMAAFFRGDYVKAELDLNQSLTRRPDYVTYSTLGTILAKRGGGVNTEQALQRFRHAARINPGALEPLIAEVKLYLDLPDPNYMDAYERIRQTLNSNSRLGERSREILALRDEIEIKLLKRNKSESYTSPEAAEAALKLYSGSLYPLYYLATHYEKAGEPTIALKYAERLYRRARNQMIPNLVYARILLQTGEEHNLQKAEEILDQAHELDRRDGRPLYLGVKVARARGQADRAWRLLSRTSQVDPYDTESRLEIALGCYNTGQKGGARYVVDYLNSIHRDPPYALRRLDLELKLDEKKIDAAAQDLAALEKLEGVPAVDLEYFRGRLNEVQGRTARAIACYDRALAKAPGDGQIVVAAARLELAEEDERAALKRLLAYRERGGKNAEVDALLGDMLLARWRVDEAMEVFQEMRAINFGDWRGQIGFGLCALYSGKQVDAGIWSLEYAFQSMPPDPKFLERRRRVLRAAVFGRLERRSWTQAVALMGRLDETDPGSAARARALLAYFNGDHDAARRLVTRWLRETPEAPYLRFLHGLLAVERSYTEGVQEDVSAVVSDVRPGRPWKTYVLRVARELPGFGRLVVATAARTALLEDDVATAAEILRAARTVYPADRRLAALDAHVAYRQRRPADAVAILKRLAPDARPDEIRDYATIQGLEGADDAPELMSRYARTNPSQGDPLLAWARFEAGGDHYLEVLEGLRAKPNWRWEIMDQVVMIGLACLVDGPEFAFRFLPGSQSLPGPYLRRWVKNATTPARLHRVARLVRAAAIGRIPLFRHRAINELQRLLADAPDDPLLLALLARLHLDAHRTEAAADLVKRMDNPRDLPLALLARARIEAADADGIPAAKATLEELTRLRPFAIEAQIALGRVLLAAGKSNDAAEVLVQTHDQPDIENNPRRLLALGQALEASGDPTGAVTAYARARHSAPSNEEIAFHLVRRLLRSRSHIEAVAVLASHPRLATARPEIRLELGLALVRFEQYGSAEKFLTGFPYSPEAALNLGRIALARKDRKEAIRQMRYAFHLDSKGHLHALLEVAKIHLAEYSYKAALRVINELLAHDPTNREGRVIQARCMEQIAKSDQALYAWIQAWTVDQSNPEPLLKGASLLRKKGQTDLAKVLLGLVRAQRDKLDEKNREMYERECYYLGIEP